MISTHVLDTALGAPARSLAVRLEVLEGFGAWRTVANAVTNADGRVPGLAEPGPLAGRTCRLCFDVGAYLASSRRPVFFPTVEVTFLVGEDASYHVPLLLSPFGYSIYRGS